jgi:ABC-type uncharacterized transport system substrate-binding protein
MTSTARARIVGGIVRPSALAAQMIAANLDVIIGAGMIDTLPVHALTRTVPIVVIGGTDLVEDGLADSLTSGSTRPCGGSAGSRDSASRHRQD